ncbi:MAG: hypothetical protein H8E44_28020 [Planctomycetes bacterium]|nr:hypothetical protein [Planctomycetota bacterium]
MSDSATPKSERRWYYFALRTLLGPMLLVISGCGPSEGERAMDVDNQNPVGLEMKEVGDRSSPVADPGPAARKAEPAVVEPVPITEEQAIAKIEKLGGMFEVDEKTPGRPVVAVLLRGTQVTDASLKYLRGLTNLEMLSLFFTHVTDGGLEHLEGMTNLRTLSLCGTLVTDAGLVHLKELNNLAHLELLGTHVTDAGLEHLKDMTNLRTLGLPGFRVTDAGLEHLKGLTSLRKLGLDGTEVTDAGLEHLKGLTNLRELPLYGSQVTDEGVKDLQKALPDCFISR